MSARGPRLYSSYHHMRVLIDATPLQTGHRQRGVGTYTRELLRALLALDLDTEYRLIVHPFERQTAD